MGQRTVCVCVRVDSWLEKVDCPRERGVWVSGDEDSAYRGGMLGLVWVGYGAGGDGMWVCGGGSWVTGDGMYASGGGV